MNKSAIQSFTVNAKNKLMDLIKQKAFEYGIEEKNIIEDNSVINGKVLSDVEKKQRKKLIKKIKEDGYNQVIEEVTYTWFNRFIALRFMEVNGYLPSRTRVFSDENNNFNPQILKEALNVELDKLDRNIVISFLNNNDNEGLYKYLLVCQCNSLNKIIPVLFEKISDYTELLFPDNLLKKDSVLNDLVNDISEEDWKEQVQILGWIYQFYVADKKDKIFASKETITKNTLAAVTQLFTPDWIVRYMAENSLGRIWLESYPDSSLKNEMKYYVEDAKQEDAVQKQIDEIKYKNVNPEDITVIEPCCGSGHILVYIFDLLYKMYEEQGYKKSDIPTLILEKNMYGLDIDKRASQLAYFSLIMKARSVDNRLFNRDKIVTPNVFEIIDSKAIKQDDYVQIMKDNNFSKESIEIAKYLVETFENGKVIGSLLKVERYNYKLFLNELKEKKDKGPNNIFSSQFYSQSIPEFMKLTKLAVVLSKKYDVMITNPPYISISSMEKYVKDYANKYYPNSKADMFAMFMETDFSKKNGFIAMINMQAWIYQSSFKKLRENILYNKTIINMLHLKTRAFEMISGEVVSTISFIIKNVVTNKYISTIYKLGDYDAHNKEIAFLKKLNEYNFNNDDFKKMPNYSLGYWLSAKIISTFSCKTKYNSLVLQKVRICTGNNNYFVRLWHEVEKDTLFYPNKWVLYNKGDGFRRWYGNLNYVLNYENNGEELKKYPKYEKSDENYYFKIGITYNKIASNYLAMRYLPYGTISDAASPMLYEVKKTFLYYSLAIANSIVFQKYVNFLCQGLDNTWGCLSQIPTFISDLYADKINELAKISILLSKNDWNSFETSWGFDKHPLV